MGLSAWEENSMQKKKQLVFVDDSGDPGFKKGSSTHFVIACIVFDNEAEVTQTAEIMNELRSKLGWRQKEEFKFNKTRKDHIVTLLKLLERVNFKIYATIIEKSKVGDALFKRYPGAFYNHVIKETLLLCELRNAKIRLDGHAGRSYTKSAVAYFRKSAKIDDYSILDIKFTDSAENVLIQLADLVAGAILRSTKPDKTDSQTYIKLLMNKISVIDIG